MTVSQPRSRPCKSNRCSRPVVRTARPRTPALMLQGTGSDVGKSLVVAGLARAALRRGLVVRPFKPQNMSNNAAVTADGGEIGRAQALQARAAGVAPSVHMNPVLLKPTGEQSSQVVVQGQAIGVVKARDYAALKPTLMPRVLESFYTISQGADLVLVEGAGSPAEVNLRAGDIANMGFAEAADVPVVLVADIDRGGVLASLVGTMALLPTAERQRIKGYLINKFRGDVGLFRQAETIIAAQCGLPSLGTIPWFAGAARLPAEDSLAVASSPMGGDGKRLRVVVPRLPRLSNFDDLDPLIAEPGVEVMFIGPGHPLPVAEAIILPGSKATRADLAALRAEGWDIDILAHHRRGGVVMGLCGGFQMLGQCIDDPDGLEGEAGQSPGLGLLDITTTLARHKHLRAVGGQDIASGARVTGYEMHMGVSHGPGLARPWLRLDPHRPEGAVSANGLVSGCYIHGLFADDGFRSAFLQRLGGAGAAVAYEAGVEASLDALAAHFEQHLNIPRLLELSF